MKTFLNYISLRLLKYLTSFAVKANHSPFKSFISEILVPMSIDTVFDYKQVEVAPFVWTAKPNSISGFQPIG